MIDRPTFDTLLQRVDTLGRELELLRWDLLRTAASPACVPVRKPTWFGSVPAGDVTGEKKNYSRRWSNP